MRGATFYILPTMRARDISIHAPHAGRDAGDKYITGSNCISIHAPLAGCDVEHIQHTVWFSPYFNPRAPCGARLFRCCKMFLPTRFQSTRPVRGATVQMLQDVLANEISIHAPRAGRDRRVSRASKAPRISIHAPRAGRDRRLRLYRADPEISIHAPRAGRDMRDDSAYSIRRHISIHAPRAGRDVIILRIRIEQSAFQSTRPVRGATMLRTAML